MLVNFDPMTPTRETLALTLTLAPGDCTRRDQWRHFRTPSVYMIRTGSSMAVVNGEGPLRSHGRVLSTKVTNVGSIPTKYFVVFQDLST